MTSQPTRPDSGARPDREVTGNEDRRGSRRSTPLRVLLIDVPFDSADIGGEAELFAGVENVIPALGLAYLAAVAEQEGHQVRVLEGVLGLGWERIAEVARTFEPQLVGLGLTTPTFLNAVRVAKAVRAVVPEATIVAGGPHPTAMPEHTAAAGVFDLLVQGEGEGPFRQLLRHLGGVGPALEAIPGLGVIRGGSLRLSPPGPPIQDLDSIPLPARHLLAPLSAYAPCPASLRQLPLAHIMTSRGCPSRCNFCDRAVFGSHLRQRSVANVMAEVDQVVARYGAREIRFFDDTFTLNRQRLYAICAELRRFSPRIPWTCLTKVNAVDLDMLREMRAAGCWQVLYGLESGDDAVLRDLGKGTTVAQNRRAVHLARQAGLRVRADFLVGSPTETLVSLRATMAFAKELPIDFAHFNKFVPFPGTTFYERLVAEGHSFDFTTSSTLDHDALVYVPPGLEPSEYRAFLDHCYREFYFRPRYLLRRLSGLRTLTEAWVNARGTLSIGSM